MLQTVYPTYLPRTRHETDAQEVSPAAPTPPTKGTGNLAAADLPQCHLHSTDRRDGFSWVAAGRLSDNAVANMIADVSENPRVTLCLQMCMAPDAEKSAESARESRFVGATLLELPTRPEASLPHSPRRRLAPALTSSWLVQGEVSVLSPELGHLPASGQTGLTKHTPAASEWRTALHSLFSCGHPAHTQENVGVPPERQSEAASYTGRTRVCAL